jgi:transcriptional regulator with XRE-family HTH domain
MPGQRRPPQARDRAIGAQLRAIRRQQTSLSLEAAAELLQWSAPTMSRTENGKRRITAEDVATILATYRVPIEQRNALVARAKAIDEPGWWSRPLPGVSDNTGALASYEAEARTVIDWSINVIPGLLQTYEYAKAYMLDFGESLENVESLWMARLRRQQVVPAVDYTAFIGECALRTSFGGQAFAGQLRHLLDANKRGIGIRVVPAFRPHAALLQSWMLLEFPDSPPIVHVELLRSAVFLHNEETDPYVEHHARLQKIAFSITESRDMLKRLIEQLEGKR